MLQLKDFDGFVDGILCHLTVRRPFTSGAGE